MVPIQLGVPFSGPGQLLVIAHAGVLSADSVANVVTLFVGITNLASLLVRMCQWRP